MVQPLAFTAVCMMFRAGFLPNKENQESSWLKMLWIPIALGLNMFTQIHFIFYLSFR